MIPEVPARLAGSASGAETNLAGWIIGSRMSPRRRLAAGVSLPALARRQSSDVGSRRRVLQAGETGAESDRRDRVVCQVALRVCNTEHKALVRLCNRAHGRAGIGHA